jgi:hypothetical protein
VLAEGGGEELGVDDAGQEAAVAVAGGGEDHGGGVDGTGPAAPPDLVHARDAADPLAAQGGLGGEAEDGAPGGLEHGEGRSRLPAT